MEVTAFFQKDKSCLSSKLKIKSILLFYKDCLEIEGCLLGAIKELNFLILIENSVQTLYQ